MATLTMEELIADDPAMPHVPAQPCGSLSASELLQLNASDLAADFTTPHVITGLLDAWPDVSTWLHLFTFDTSNPDEPADAERREAREEMLRVFARLYGVPAPFARSTALRVSYHNQTARRRGVTFCSHGLSWLALLTGTKQWYFAPHDVHARPTDPTCKGVAGGPHAAPPAGTTHACEQRSGELIVVPTGWWHATCNDGVTFAFGGQDECDAVPCPRDAVGFWCPTTDAQLTIDCFGDHGRTRARTDERGRYLHGDGSSVPRAPERGKLFEEAQQVTRSVDAEALREFLRGRQSRRTVEHDEV